MIDKVLPSTDNFFKYLLTIGIILIFFSILYPLQRQQELDLNINEYKKNVDIYNFKVDMLANETQSLERLSEKAQNEILYLDSLQKINPSISDSIHSIMVSLKSDFDTKKQAAIKKGEELKTVQISQQYEFQKIKKMEGYLSYYFIFKIAFIIVGILLSLSGIWFWAASAYLDEKLKVKDFDPLYRHSYVKCLDWLSKRLKRKKKV